MLRCGRKPKSGAHSRLRFRYPVVHVRAAAEHRLVEACDGASVPHRESPETRVPMRRAAVPMLIPALVLLAGAVTVGVVPALRAGTAQAAATFVDTEGYAASVLSQSRAAPVPSGATAPVLTLPSIGFGLLCAVLAIALAAAALWVSRLPTFVHIAARPGRTCMTLLHRIHAAHVGDQVAWLVVGVAVLITVLL